MLEAQKVLKRVRDEIELLVPYAVPAEDKATALSFVEKFQEDQFALEVIKDFYRTLPDALEEALVRISVVEEREQVFLLLLSTTTHHYLYLTNDEGGVFLGDWEEGLLDTRVLAFYGYADAAGFKKANFSIEECREYSPLERMDEDMCPSCGVKVGALHTLGCPVEVCPWCGGQLNHCNCRFEQLEVEELVEDEKLTELEEKLEKKGRIAYAKEQRPTFMKEGDSPEVIFE